MPYRFQAKNIFLTYSRCLETPQSLIDFLRDKLETRNPVYICVAEEEHEDGIPHLHAFISLSKKLDTANPRYFDAGDYHPNIQSSNFPKENLDYVQKDGNFIEWGECPEWIAGTENGKRKAIFADAFAAPDKETATEILKSQAPDTYATCFSNIEAALNAHYKTDSGSL